MKMLRYLSCLLFVSSLLVGCNIRTEVRPAWWPEKKPPPTEKEKGNRP